MEKLTLLDGEFSPEDAYEILLELFLSKINFHNSKNLSSRERLGIEDELSQKRIPDLRESIAKLKKIIEVAEVQNATVKIKSDVFIEY